MAGLTPQPLFRLEAHGRVLGRFLTAEPVRGGVSLVGWRPEGAAGKPLSGTIVLAGPLGAELRRWRCAHIAWAPNGVTAQRLQRA